MPSFRKVKHSNFTVIDNCIFKDYSLSAKAKGILTQMLSLPDGWNYSIAGLTTLFSDGESSIRSGLDELKSSGYLKINRITDNKGKVVDWEYVIFEDPSIPDVENPVVENPHVDNRAQLNTEESNTDKSNTYPYIGHNEDVEKNQTPYFGPVESDTSKPRMRDKLSTRNSKKSIIPSEKEVVDYCIGNNLDVDPYYFFRYYSEQGWHDSHGNPVKNWKGRIRTWHSKSSAKKYSAEKSSVKSDDTVHSDELLAKALDEYPWCRSIDDFHVIEQYGERYLIPRFTEDGRELDRRGIPVDGKPI